MPSVVSTIFQLRSGAIETLRDKEINNYRVAPDQVAILTGSLFWGSLLGSIVFGGIFASIVFFFVVSRLKKITMTHEIYYLTNQQMFQWQATAYFAQRLLSLLVGLIVITLTRIAIVSFCRCKFYTSFYRQRPAPANMSLLGLEWASFFLSAGFVFFRMIKLIIIAAAFIGRIDRPLLARGIGRIGPIELDGYPLVHTKDLLSHEAHRHPFIELLGVIVRSI